GRKPREIGIRARRREIRIRARVRCPASGLPDERHVMRRVGSDWGSRRWSEMLGCGATRSAVGMNPQRLAPWPGWREGAVRVWLSLTLLCSVLACGESPRIPANAASGGADSAAEVASSPSEGASAGSKVAGWPAAPTPDSAESRTPATEPPRAQASPSLALDPEGLRLVDRETGRARSIAFGSPGDFVVEVTSLALGAPLARGSSRD